MAAGLYKEEDSWVYNIGSLEVYEILAGSEAWITHNDLLDKQKACFLFLLTLLLSMCYIE